jgi:transcriptional regulator with XRE-family HTH domain
MGIALVSEKRMGQIIAHRVRALRLAANLSQKSLAQRAGVNYSTLRLFERTGQISLFHLALLASALNRGDDLLGLFKIPEVTSLAEVEAKRTIRKRGRI